MPAFNRWQAPTAGTKSMSLTDRAQRLVQDHFASPSIPRRIAVDATCGNGHDTEFLAHMAFNQVIGFDIQERAIGATYTRISQQQISNVGLIMDGHETLGRHVPGEIDCLMFNLGYLPDGDRSISTDKTTTLVALTYATRKLSQTGIISLLCYPGHAAGFAETALIKKWLQTLGPEWKIRVKASKQPNDTTPILFSLTLKPQTNGSS